MLINHFRMEFREDSVGKFHTLGAVDLAAAGLGDTAALRSGRSAAVLNASRRDQRKKISFSWPRNTHRRDSADERGQVFLPLPKGEGWGEGEERVKIRTRCHALCPHP
jgi:hypothetical protein